MVALEKLSALIYSSNFKVSREQNKRRDINEKVMVRTSGLKKKMLGTKDLRAGRPSKELQECVVL